MVMEQPPHRVDLEGPRNIRPLKIFIISDEACAIVPL
jgi:hypothetical protein